MKKEEEYGTPVTLDELVGHYQTHFLSPDQFRDLVQSYANQQSAQAIKERGNAGLIGKKVRFRLYHEEKEGLVLDKVIVSSTGVHSTGMFHWKKETPFSHQKEAYLVQYMAEAGRDFEGYDENGNGYGSKVIYKPITVEVEPTSIIEVIKT